jgi:hypothetical protein
VDTNVIAVANDAPGIADNCIRACKDALTQAKRGLVVLDDRFRIIKEYKRYANESGRPGIGDDFLLWLLQNLYDPDRCELVPLTELSENEFAEFSSDPDLAKFDRSDRKFVAVSLTSQNAPEVLNAVDTDWCECLEPLKKNGVRIKFLCPAKMPKSECQ